MECDAKPEPQPKKDEPEKPQTAPETSKPTSETKSSGVKVVRGNKKIKLDNSEQSQPDKKDSKDDDPEAKIVRSLKRSCELWSMEDKNTFFKAVSEYGKDFDALQNYFQIQGKKRGSPENMIKNKEQIRHFYYRTWLKISKHLKFSEDVKKTSQELYGLINYGELRRKLPRTHEKVQMKLNELVYWGSTQVRFRGKTMRIKTPICRALRKLNQMEDWQEDIKLPSKVTIELRPGNNRAWWQVQTLSMNPRVRLLVPIQRRVSTILKFLQQRWQPVKYKPGSDVDKTIVDTENNNRLLLRLAPPERCKITLPEVNLGECLTSNSVSLNSHEKRLGLKSSRVELLGSMQYIKGVGRKGIKRYKTDKRIKNLADETVSNAENSSDIDAAESGSEKPATGASDKAGHESTAKNGFKCMKTFPGRETIERIRKGWNAEEINTITVGDLFLMFGQDSNITLEYWWDTPQSRDDGLCSALRKLLSLAKHSYGASKIHDNVSASNETVVSARVNSNFKRPLIPLGYHKVGVTDAFESQMAKFKSRFCKRGRTVRPRNLIVQRTLPVVQDTTSSAEVPSISMDTMSPAESSPCNLVNDQDRSKDVIDEHNFLNGVLEMNDSAKATNSIYMSASQILKEGEHQWLNSEVADFSLSSFLGQLESPVKVTTQSHADSTIHIVKPPSDVISNMQCLMGENSVDYVKRFANLASQIAAEDPTI